VGKLSIKVLILLGTKELIPERKNYIFYFNI